jgi:osmoprotectant transport system permease protein
VFPKYDAGIIVHNDIYKQYPDLKAVLLLLENKINDVDMQQMNYQVDVKHQLIEEVVFDFLQ